MPALFSRTTLVLPGVLFALGAWGGVARAESSQLGQALERLDSSDLAPGDVFRISLPQASAALEALSKRPHGVCKEKRLEFNTPHIATTFDANGLPCKIYDLSFPVVMRGKAIAPQWIGSLTLQNFSDGDYLDGVMGEWDAVIARAAQFSAHASAENSEASWFSLLKFKDGKEGGLPHSFRLSDVELGSRFEFSSEQKAALKKILAASSDFSSWNGIVENPQALLEKIELRYDESKKLFDIFIDGDILPFKGPVALADYNVQYKGAVERIVRGALLDALDTVSGLIPLRPVRGLVRVVLNDAFQFVDLAFQYQTNRTERALAQVIDGKIASSIPASVSEKGMNILFAQRSEVLTQFILAKLQGGAVDLDRLDEIGKVVRYDLEKRRQSTFARLHSDLVLKKHCSMNVPYPYMGVCSQQEKPVTLYSLLSEQTTFGFSRGAVALHQFQKPEQVGARRRMAWLLSGAVRLSPLPLPSFLAQQLVLSMKSQAVRGLADEAYLLESVALEARPEARPFADYFLEWLPKQNINPLRSKDMASEGELIRRTKAQLEERIAGNQEDNS